jgi:hypothetical protein
VCFSATASYTSAALLGAAGVAVFPFVRERREVPLALLGVGFAAHQLLEGVIWTEATSTGNGPVRTPAVELWLLFAWSLLPVWVPLAVALVEPDRRRRLLMVAMAPVGVAVGLFLGVASFTARVAATAEAGHLVYSVPFSQGWIVVIPYVAVTCGSPLVAGAPYLRVWGVALATAMATTASLQARGFSSVWCFFAAILTIVLLGHFASRSMRHPAGAASATRSPETEA